MPRRERRLRIAFFLFEFPAVSETFVLNQITGLLDLGHDVTIFAVRPRSEPMVHHDVSRYRLMERTRYQTMPADRIARVGTAAALLIRDAWRRPGLLRAFNIRRYDGEASSLRLFYWCKAIPPAARFDVIQCHFGPPGRMAAFLREIGAISGKIVVAFHAVDVSLYLRNDPHFYRHVFAHGDLFLPISDYCRKRLLEHGCDASRTVVHRMGVDPNRFRARASSAGPSRALRAISIGRLVEKKGIEYGLRAVALAARRQHLVRYGIVGDGPLRPELEALASELGIADRVTFHGWQDQASVAELLAASDVLLAPSVTEANGDEEGIPMTLMEAMASGLPVLSTRHAGIPELVEDDVSGFLAPERDHEALAAVLMQLSAEPGRMSGMGRAGRARIEAEYDLSKLNNRLVGLYETLLDRRPACPGSRETIGMKMPERMIAAEHQRVERMAKRPRKGRRG